MEIKQITAQEAQEWFGKLPASQRLATLSPEYVCIDARRDPALEPYFILFQDKEKGYFWLRSVHRGMVPNSDFYDFQSAYGYGGPVHFSVEQLPDIGDTAPRYDFLFIAEMQYRKWCWENNIIAEFVRYHPLLNQGGNRTYNRDTIVVPVGAKYTESCRNKVNKAYRSGIEVFEANREDISLFAVEYYKSLEKLGAEKFYYFNEEYFDALAKWDKAHLLVAEIDKCFVSACILLEGGDTMESHLTVTNERGYEVGATNALVDGELTFTKKMGKKQLFLGGGKTISDGDSLLTFKKSFGGIEKSFYVGQEVYRQDAYEAMSSAAFDVAPVSRKVIFWR